MYADNAQISGRQLFRQICTGLLGVYLLVIPAVPSLQGRQGILCVLAGTGIYILLSPLFVRVQQVFRRPDQYLGKVLGNLLVWTYLSWLWLAGIWLLLAIARITERFFVEDSASFVVITLAAAAAWLGSHQGMERRGRMMEVTFPLLFLILGGMLFLALLKMNPAYLKETGPLTLQGFFSGTRTVTACFLPFLFLPFTLGNVKTPGNVKGKMAGALGLLGGSLALCILILQGSFGLGGYGHKSYPMFDLMAGVRIPGHFVERVDIFWIGAVMFSILLALGSVFFYQHEILVRIRMEKTAGILALLVAGAAQISLAAGIPEEWFFSVTRQVYGPCFFFWFLYALARGRKKRAAVTAGVLVLLVLPLLSSCGIPLEKRTFPLSMSADYQEGKYRIIYGIPQLSAVTGQNKESGQGQEEAVEYLGETPKQARENFNRNQESYLDLGHLKALILGESLLEEEERLEEFLGFLEENPSVAGNIYVFSCEDNRDLMSLDGQVQDSVGDYLTGILENTMRQEPAEEVTLQDLYNAWHRGEDMPQLPRVTVENNRPRIE